jgi:Flp pilus assembly pilin Flp
MRSDSLRELFADQNCVAQTRNGATIPSAASSLIPRTSALPKRHHGWGGISITKEKGTAMKQLLSKFWNDDNGALIATEYLFVVTILVIGVIVGMTNVRDALIAELTEVGNALLALSQGFTISGTSGGTGSTDGSQAIDTPGSLAAPQAVPPAFPSVIDVPVCGN